MMLSEQSKAALERRREKLEATGGFRGVILTDEDSSRLADEMLRLFPVKTLNGVVIRWDDEITPERLVASGWEVSFSGKSGRYRRDAELKAKSDKYELICVYVQSQNKGVQYTSINFSEYDLDQGFPEYLTPTNMGEVWQLMEKCECPVGGGE